MHYGLSIVKLITKYNLNNINIDTKLFHKAYVNMKHADLQSAALWGSFISAGLINSGHAAPHTLVLAQGSRDAWQRALGRAQPLLLPAASIYFDLIEM